MCTKCPKVAFRLSLASLAATCLWSGHNQRPIFIIFDSCTWNLEATFFGTCPICNSFRPWLPHYAYENLFSLLPSPTAPSIGRRPRCLEPNASLVCRRRPHKSPRGCATRPQWHTSQLPDKEVGEAHCSGSTGTVETQSRHLVNFSRPPQGKMMGEGGESSLSSIMI